MVQTATATFSAPVSALAANGPSNVGPPFNSTVHFSFGDYFPPAIASDIASYLSDGCPDSSSQPDNNRAIQSSNRVKDNSKVGKYHQYRSRENNRRIANDTDEKSTPIKVILKNLKLLRMPSVRKLKTNGNTYNQKQS